MLRAWVVILNGLSTLEFRLADAVGEAAAVAGHFLLFWIFPIGLLFLPHPMFAVVAIVFAMFYIYVLAGDMLLSVFGHEDMEKKRGMIDITSVNEIREEIVGALIKYLGAIVSFATIFNGLNVLLNGKAFAIAHPTPIPYFDLLYYSQITITTVGYGDISPIHWVAKVFVMFEVLFGVGFALLLFTMLVSLYLDIQRRKKQ